jgi:energy-coupling factor transporter transmembrane protein EcfT
MKKNTSARFVIVVMVIVGVLLAAISIYLRNYWLLLFAGAWLLMPFTISFTYKEDDEGITDDRLTRHNLRQNQGPSSKQEHNITSHTHKE